MAKNLLTLLAAVILFMAGSLHTVIRQSNDSRAKHYFRVSSVPEAELKFLKTLESAQFLPPRFVSATYILEIQMPTGDITRRTLEIPFSDSQFDFKSSSNPGRVGMEESAIIEGHTVSWHDEGVLYDAGVKYVGVVSGRQMYGHVYNYVQTPEGEVGFWRIYPKFPDKLNFNY
jgi:hypothetical protein